MSFGAMRTLLLHRTRSVKSLQLLLYLTVRISSTRITYTTNYTTNITLAIRVQQTHEAQSNFWTLNCSKIDHFAPRADHGRDGVQARRRMEDL